MRALQPCLDAMRTAFTAAALVVAIGMLLVVVAIGGLLRITEFRPSWIERKG
jgi:uncharacterized membrane protein